MKLTDEQQREYDLARELFISIISHPECVLTRSEATQQAFESAQVFLQEFPVCISPQAGAKR